MSWGYANLRDLLKAEEPYPKAIKVGDANTCLSR
jgi:hypothetical protein